MPRPIANVVCRLRSGDQRSRDNVDRSVEMGKKKAKRRNSEKFLFNRSVLPSRVFTHTHTHGVS